MLCIGGIHSACFAGMNCSARILGATLVLIGGSACGHEDWIERSDDAGSRSEKSKLGAGSRGDATRDAGCPTCLSSEDAGPAIPRGEQAHDAVDFAAIREGNFAAISCRQGRPPASDQVPANWTEAQTKLPPCANPRKSLAFAARCGEYDAFVTTGTDSRLYYLYDATGQLVAYYDIGIGSECIAFSPSFNKPERCDVVSPKCPVASDNDAGS